jgi:hypothetical protein
MVVPERERVRRMQGEKRRPRDRRVRALVGAVREADAHRAEAEREHQGKQSDRECESPQEWVSRSGEGGEGRISQRKREGREESGA